MNEWWRSAPTVLLAHVEISTLMQPATIRDHGDWPWRASASLPEDSTFFIRMCFPSDMEVCMVFQDRWEFSTCRGP